MQQYADIYLLLNYSTYFGRSSRPSSAVHKTVVALSGTDSMILTPRPNYPRERTPIPIWYETGWEIEQIWTFRGRNKSNASACWSVAFEITYNTTLLWHFTAICFRWFVLITFVFRNEETFCFPEKQHKSYHWICLWCLDIIFLSVLKYFQRKFVYSSGSLLTR